MFTCAYSRLYVQQTRLVQKFVQNFDVVGKFVELRCFCRGSTNLETQVSRYRKEPWTLMNVQTRFRVN
jgi:hypothetical protein